MSGIIEGYNYDIFVSYRQKDNKGDKWVSEFVEALKTELESTFKEEISVYFDINTHDGLLETHDVDGSLKEKLKCLVFIPIISRTYCDPKSFAWEHEFKAFVELASQDQFGLKVKLPGGNVANRVLPVQIHDLDSDDRILVETELGGFLRGIEFIYKEPGVDRPLTSKDNEEKNFNKTSYRNQINKVALAIREIITAIKQYNPHYEEAQKEAFKSVYVPRKINKAKLIAYLAIALTLIILGSLFVPKLFKSQEQLEKSIAVLPFENWNSGEEYQHLGDAIANEIVTQLSLINQFHVISYTSSSHYKGSDKPHMHQIGKELGANFIIEGAVERKSEDVSIHVQVINATIDDHIWAEEFKGKWKDIFTIRANIAKKVAEKLNTVLPDDEVEQLEKNPTDNLEAYNLYLKGTNCWQMMTTEGYKKASEYFEQALKIDSNYALAYAGLAGLDVVNAAWGNISPHEAYPKINEYVNKALKIDSTCARAYNLLGIINSFYYWNWKEAEQNFKIALKKDPNSSLSHSSYSVFLLSIGRNEEAVSEAKQALRLDPFSPYINTRMGLTYTMTGHYDMAIEEYRKILANNPKYFLSHVFLGITYSENGMVKEAINELEKAVGLSGGNPFAIAWLVSCYYQIGENEKADNLYNSLKNRSDTEYVPATSFFLIHWVRGEEDLALEWLERAFNEHDSFLPLFRNRIPEGSKYTALYKEIGML